MSWEERGAAAPVDTDPYVGVVAAGRFELIEQLGKGGMGSVYRARHVVLKRDFALKLLRNRGLADAGRKRFEREAFAAARLEHPNCVAVTDFGTLDDGTLFLAMELVDGEPLSTVLEREGRLTPQRALHVMRHTMTGLAHAHERGVVHRDLKPANVMLVDHLGDHDFAKVVDFGLAKLIGDAELEAGGGKLTAAGITFGTPRYISPEQAFGKPVDHRADLYSASVMLFEMLAGKLPFDGSDARQILMMHATRAVPRMHEVAPGVTVPLDIEMLVRQGLAKDPRDRMSNALEYIAAIDRCVAGLEQASTGRINTPRPELIEAPVLGTDETRPLSPPLVPMAQAVAAQPPSVAPVPPPPASVVTSQAMAPRRRLVGPIAGVGVAAVAGVIALSIASGSGSPPAATSAGAPASAVTAAKPVGDAQPRAGTAPTPAPPYPIPATAVAARSNPPEITPSPAAEKIEAAVALARAGHDHQAEKALLSLRKRYPEDGAVAYALGNLYAVRPWPTRAISSYRDAIHLDPGYRDDPRITAYAIRQLTSRSAHRAAERLLVNDIGNPALPALRETQHGHKIPRIRAVAGQMVASIERRSQD